MEKSKIQEEALHEFNLWLFLQDKKICPFFAESSILLSNLPFLDVFFHFFPSLRDDPIFSLQFVKQLSYRKLIK